MSIAACLACLGCSQAPDPTARRQDLRVGEEVYRIFCKRVARDSFPDEATGVRFNTACEQGPDGLDAATDRPRFRALVERRTELVAALDQMFGDTPVDGGALFRKEDGEPAELDQFLKQMIPFYDDGTLPASTRAIAEIAKKLAAAEDARASAVLDKLALLSTRQGYRLKTRTSAATRAMLTYPRIDEVSERLLSILGEGGAGNAIFQRILEAAVLELADGSDGVDNADSTLRVATGLLLSPLRDPETVAAAKPDARAFLASADETAPRDAVYFVRRDDLGNAKLDAKFQPPEGTSARDLPTPFAAGGRSENLGRYARDAGGRLTVGSAGPPIWAYGDANASVLGALLREQKPLLARNDAGEKSTLEKLLRGLKPLLGAQAAQTFTFNSGRKYTFQGPSVADSPLLDLVHALASLAKFEETDRLLEVLRLLIAKYESEAAGPIHAALAIDRDADMDGRAQLVGSDGTPETPSEFWDDLIAVGQRIAQRPGMLEAALRAFSRPSAVANSALIAKFMKFKDRVTYEGAPLSPATPGEPASHSRPAPSHPNHVYDAQQATLLNQPIDWQLSIEVDRSQPDTGMNRSLFQRLISAIDATNGAENCNKEGAILHSSLDFPYHEDGGTAGYPRCALVRQPSGAETHMRSILGRALVKLKDAKLLEVAEILKRDVGAEQERLAQVQGFNLTPTPEALARFAMAPRNSFLAEMFDPFATKHGVAMVAYEPDILFALEAKQDDVRMNSEPQSFLTATKELLQAFDDHELFASSADGEVASDGYLFAELLSTLHLHWPSSRPEDCPEVVAAGEEGCSQHLDPSRPFYAKQSNVVSYEPLLVRALEEQRLGEVLQQSSARLAEIHVQGADGQMRDGITVLSDFVKVALLPSEKLAYRDGTKSTKTNACVPRSDAAGCVAGRGRILEQTTPLYLLLDALKRIDEVWAKPENAERHATWLKARSELVEQLLATRREDPGDYKMQNRRGRALALELLAWLGGKVLGELHALRNQDGTQGDRVRWADGLSQRLADSLAHPLVAHGLDLLDVLWDDRAASAELARLNLHLMDYENNPAGFMDLALAAADTLESADMEPDLTPIVQFAALAIAPDAFSVIARDSSAPPNVFDGAAYTGLELTRQVALLDAYRGKPELSPISKILKNALLPGGAIDSRAPMEVIFDAIAEVNRADPALPPQTPLTREDNRRIFDQLRQFMLDEERGLERLYRVVQGRSLADEQVEP
jgi:hypothetical protein